MVLNDDQRVLVAERFIVFFFRNDFNRKVFQNNPHNIERLKTIITNPITTGQVAEKT